MKRRYCIWLWFFFFKLLTHTNLAFILRKFVSCKVLNLQFSIFGLKHHLEHNFWDFFAIHKGSLWISMCPEVKRRTADLGSQDQHWHDFLKYSVTTRSKDIKFLGLKVLKCIYRLVIRSSVQYPPDIVSGPLV